jgi:hypothetical protein
MSYVSGLFIPEKKENQEFQVQPENSGPFYFSLCLDFTLLLENEDMNLGLAFSVAQ